MLIALEKETVTFFKGNGEDFKTVTISALASRGFSEMRFVMLKYVTAILKHMSDKLYGSS